MDYTVAKWLHIPSATFVFGTGIGSAWYLLLASLTRDARAVAVTARHVVWADWLFTATTMVFQPLSGWYMARLAGIPLSTAWLQGSIVLYVVAGACWLPVVWLQIRMRDLARRAVRAHQPLPPRYFMYLRWWVALGVPAFVAFVGVFWLMVAKPT